MKKKPTNFRFHTEDLTLWKRIAKRKKLSLTELIENAMKKECKQKSETHLFI